MKLVRHGKSGKEKPGRDVELVIVIGTRARCASL
jgi:hypothetical protein